MTYLKRINSPKLPKSLENGLLLPKPKVGEFRSVQGQEMHFAQSLA